MADRALTQSQIQNLLSREAPKIVKWPSDDDLVRLAKAVRDEQELVTFRDGRVFHIRYDTRWDSVFVKPHSNDVFVPCGYFSHDRLRGILKHGVES